MGEQQMKHMKAKIATKTAVQLTLFVRNKCNQIWIIDQSVGHNLIANSWFVLNKLLFEFCDRKSPCYAMNLLSSPNNSFQMVSAIFLFTLDGEWMTDRPTAQSSD